MTKQKISGNYVLRGLKIGIVKDVDVNAWFGHVTLDNFPAWCAEYGTLDPDAEIHSVDGKIWKSKR